MGNLNGGSRWGNRAGKWEMGFGISTPVLGHSSPSSTLPPSVNILILPFHPSSFLQI